ncbi:hypothetical protein MKW94_030380, partial [Papaver nudicaule]|nr:hypothetical protein [Papaver nudicaule]
VSEVSREVNHLLMPDPATNKTIIRAQRRDKSCQLLHPEYIAGIILASVKKTAELHLGSKITSAVISVP